MFYTYRQNNSGGSFHFDDRAGISVEVVVEANSPGEASLKAERIGLYWNGCDSGRDCSCCGDRWYNSPDESTDPPVAPGTPFPAEVEDRFISKWMEEGKPEGFIHFADGRVEGYHATTNQRKDLDGTYGWGVQYNKYGAVKFLCGKSGWDETGNYSAPWAKYAISGDGGGEPPDVDKMVKTDKTHGYGCAWFRVEDDADQFVADYNRAVLGLTEVVRRVKSLAKEGEKVPSDVLKTAKAVFLK